MYQLLKYFLVRAGLSLVLLATFGFFVLYFVHEIALPQEEINDVFLQGLLGIICVFLGWAGYGLVGEQRFQNAMHALKDIDLKSDEEEVIRRFEYLLQFTSSSYFLPGKGRRLRDRVIREYADYLVSIGRDDSDALKIYLRAFLQNPRDSKYRVPLTSILGRGEDLSPEEIDLLLVVWKAGEYRDKLIAGHLASVFLRRKQFTSHAELIYLRAVESGSPGTKEIVSFVVPLLLDKNRSDELALRFYLAALPCHLQEEPRLRQILARGYCRGHWEVANPTLHAKCKNVFLEMDPRLRESLMREAEKERISGSAKPVEEFSREDRREMERVKRKLGLVPAAPGLFRTWTFRLGSLLAQPFRWVGWSLRNGWTLLAGLRWKTRLIAAAVLAVLLLVGSNYQQWADQVQEMAALRAAKPDSGTPETQPVAQKPAKIHTIQIAAVTSKKHADRVVRTLAKGGIEGVYVVKVKRSSGGTWYKIRLKQFDAMEQARSFADQLIDRKIIKNYFIISLPKTQEP